MTNYADIKPRLGDGAAAAQPDVTISNLPTKEAAKEAPVPTDAQTQSYDSIWSRGDKLAKLGASVKPEVAEKWVQSDLKDFHVIKTNPNLTRSTLLDMQERMAECPPYQTAMTQAAPNLARSAGEMQVLAKAERAAANGNGAPKAAAGATGSRPGF